jgi:hypothetical protein
LEYSIGGADCVGSMGFAGDGLHICRHLGLVVLSSWRFSFDPIGHLDRLPIRRGDFDDCFAEGQV